MTTAVRQNGGDWDSFTSDVTFSPHLSPLHAAGHVAESSTVPHDPQRNGERDTRQEGFREMNSNCALFFMQLIGLRI